MLIVFACFKLYGQDLGNLGSSSGIFKASGSKSGKTTRPIKPPSKPTQPETAQRKKVTRSPIITRRQNISELTLPPSLLEAYEELLFKGNLARDERNYALAEDIYTQASKINPRDFRAFYGLGNVFSDQQRWEEAERFYRKALELDSQNVQIYTALIFTLTQPLIGLDLSKRYIEAEKLARKAVKLAPSNAIVYHLLGTVLELRGVLNEETENAYKKAIQLEPDFALPYAHLSRLFNRKGETEKANRFEAEALKRAKSVPTLILTAEVLQSQQKFVESERLLRLALLNDPKNPLALFLLGRALAVRNEFKEAETILKLSIEANPNNFAAYLQLAYVYTNQKKYDLAEKTLEKASDVALKNERRRIVLEFEALADKLIKEGDQKGAIRIYEKALAVSPKERRILNKINKSR